MKLNENPCFYVQYAYARISSIKRIAEQKNQKIDIKNIKFKMTNYQFLKLI